MIEQLKEKWKFSKLRFYYKNFLFNIEFFFMAKKQFSDIEYTKGEAIFKPERVKRHRFKGYLFKGKIYTDNPGLLNIESSVWHYWKNKGYF